MNKYLAVAKIHFKMQLAYRFDAAMTVMGVVWRVVFAWVLWGAIFAGREDVGGFTFQAMLSYYVISSFLATADTSQGTVYEISSRVRDGSFTKFMVVPSNPQFHFLSQAVGASGFYGLVAALAVAVCAFAFRIDMALAVDPAAVLLAAALFAVGIVFMNCYHFFLGILAFKFEDSTFAIHMLPSVVSFFKGEMVPLSLLPVALEQSLRFFPFAHAVYTPAMLLMGAMDASEGLPDLFVLAAWTLAMAAGSQLAYSRLRKRHEGVGI